MATGLQGRQYFLDWLRIAAFAYLIFFHVSNGFMDPPYAISALNQNSIFSEMAMFTHIWRMELVFFVSGAAMSFMLVKFTILQFLKERTFRLLVPLALASLTINGFGLYFLMVDLGHTTKDILSFYTEDYITFSNYNRLSSYTAALWYLQYLWAIILATIPIFYWAKSNAFSKQIEKIDDLFSSPLTLTFAPILLLSICWYFLNTQITEHREFAGDYYKLSHYFIIFAFGFLMVRMEKVWETIEKMRWVFLGLALAFMGYNLIQPFPGSVIIYDGLFYLVPLKWITLLCLLGWAKHLFNKPHPFLAYGNNAVYPFYVLHYPITWAAIFYIRDVAKSNEWGIITEFSITLFVVYFSCWVIHHYIIRNIPYFGAAFGYKRPKQPIPQPITG